MIGTTPASSPASSPSRHHPRVETPVHRASRRLQGLCPEFGLLQGSLSATAPTQEMALASTTQVTVQNNLVPKSFRGDTYEDAEDWLDQYERVARVNQWRPDQKLSNVYFALDGSARTWFQNREAHLTTWDEFCRRLIDTFGSTDRRDNAQRLLELRIQKPNESVSMFAEDMSRLFRRADPNMPDSKKLSHLMRGVKEQLFAGLVRNPPTTVEEFIKEATAIERALQQRSRQNERLTNDAPAGAAVLAVTDETSLRQLIRDIVREEIAKQTATPKEFTVASVAEVVRQEIRQAFASPEPLPEPCPEPRFEPRFEPRYEPRAYSYADAVRRPLSTVPVQQYHQRPPTAAWIQREHFRRPQLRRTDVWRTADRRPLCFHCGEPGHIYRFCPHRQGGIQEMSPATPRQFPERNPRFDDSITREQGSSANLRSRSPSPLRYSSPDRRSFADVVRGRSPSPRRGN